MRTHTHIDIYIYIYISASIILTGEITGIYLCLYSYLKLFGLHNMNLEARYAKILKPGCLDIDIFTHVPLHICWIPRHIVPNKPFRSFHWWKIHWHRRVIGEGDRCRRCWNSQEFTFYSSEPSSLLEKWWWSFQKITWVHWCLRLVALSV